MELAQLVYEAIDRPPHIAVVGHDGSTAGPPDAATTIQLRSPDALHRVLSHPGELGLVRAFVAGDVDVDGDLYALLSLGSATTGRHARSACHPTSRSTSCGPLVCEGCGASRRLPRRRTCTVASTRSTATPRAISHHYDVSNEFYRMVLGPAMTYSCAVYRDPDEDLASAQTNKHDLVCRKLGLRPDMRLLDVGCGWGSMLIHAASNYGVRGVGITISQRQAELAEKRVAEAGLGDLVQIRLQDYRDIDDAPVRRDQLRRDVRARRPRPHALLRPPSLRAADAGGPRAQPRHLPAAGRSRPTRFAATSGGSRRESRQRSARRTTRESAARSSSATSSPTASCRRSASSCR